MKAKRYAEVHRAAIRWPASAFNYIGIDNEGNTDADYLGEVSTPYTLFFFATPVY